MNANITVAQNMTDPSSSAADPWAAAAESTPVDAVSASASADASANAASAAAAADPWAESSASSATDAAAAADPWSAANSGAADPTAGVDWLDAASNTATVPTDDGGIAQLWHQISSSGQHVQGWINDGLTWVVEHCRPFFQGVRLTVQDRLEGMAPDWPESSAAVALHELQQAWGGKLPENSAELFAVLLAMEQDELVKLLAVCAASTVDVVTPRATPHQPGAELAHAVGLDMAAW